jgi:EAL domain-containing protein (putative c-di-GMP-specific phosphodiesterase class I)
MESTTPPSTTTVPKRADVLLVDDDRFVLRAVQRMLVAGGYSVFAIDDSQAATREAMSGAYDLVVSDIHMPGLTGTELLDVLRSYGCDVPVILLTGAPSIDSAQAAVELGATNYLTKPVERDALLRAVARAAETARANRRRKSRETLKDPAQAAGFERALEKLWMAFQPIVSLNAGAPIAYEALMRSNHDGYRSPMQLLEYAEKNGRLVDLGRCVRRLCSDAVRNLPHRTSLFVNLHAQDLFDPDLYTGSLVEHAERVVLEITERGALDEVSDVGDRIRTLRNLGFRVAIDDLGAGYAGLTSIAVLEPDYVKLDMTLTREMAKSMVKRRLVGSMVDACRDCGMSVVAEGVETIRELSILRELGCDLLQGYYFARPSPDFAKVAIAA